MSSATAARSPRTKAERRRPNKGGKGARHKTAVSKGTPAGAADEDVVATKTRAGRTDEARVREARATEAKPHEAKGSSTKAAKKAKAPTASKTPAVVTAVDPNSTGPSRQPKLKAGPPPLDLEVDPEVLEFIRAIDDYRIANDRPFPSWSEVLHVLKQLGYRRR